MNLCFGVMSSLPLSSFLRKVPKNYLSHLGHRQSWPFDNCWSFCRNSLCCSQLFVGWVAMQSIWRTLACSAGIFQWSHAQYNLRGMFYLHLEFLRQRKIEERNEINCHQLVGKKWRRWEEGERKIHHIPSKYPSNMHGSTINCCYIHKVCCFPL